MSSSSSVSPASSSSYSLSSSQLSLFHANGYLVIPAFYSSMETQRMKTHCDELIQGLDERTHPQIVFQTRTDNHTKQTKLITPSSSSSSSSDYFLDSSDRIHYFFEEKSFSSTGGEKGENTLLVPKERAINKIGHALHVLDPVFRSFTCLPSLLSIASSLSYHDPIILQSMIICKQPKIGAKVDEHRDSTFLRTDPSSAVGVWIALEDATSANGCLSFVPGSHLDSGGAHKKDNSEKKIKEKRFIRQGVTVPTINNRSEWSSYVSSSSSSSPPSGPNNSTEVLCSFEGEETCHYSPSDFKEEPVTAGSLILIHGDVVHASKANLSEKSRYIYTFHLIEGEAEYDSKNWLQSKEKFLSLREQVQKEQKEKQRKEEEKN